MGWHLVGDPDPGFLRAINRLLARDTYSVLILPKIGSEEWLRPLTEGLYFMRARNRYAEQTTAAALVQPLPAGHRVAVIDRALLESDAEGAKTLRASSVRGTPSRSSTAGDSDLPRCTDRASWGIR